MGFFHLLIVNINNTTLCFGVSVDPVFNLASKTLCNYTIIYSVLQNKRKKQKGDPSNRAVSDVGLRSLYWYLKLWCHSQNITV